MGADQVVQDLTVILRSGLPQSLCEMSAALTKGVWKLQCGKDAGIEDVPAGRNGCLTNFRHFSREIFCNPVNLARYLRVPVLHFATCLTASAGLYRAKSFGWVNDLWRR